MRRNLNEHGFFLIGDIFVNAVANRDPKRSLITTANHHSCKIIVNNYSNPFSMIFK